MKTHVLNKPGPKKRLLLTLFVLSPLAVLAILMWAMAQGLWEQATRSNAASVPPDATHP